MVKLGIVFNALKYKACLLDKYIFSGVEDMRAIKYLISDIECREDKSLSTIVLTFIPLIRCVF